VADLTPQATQSEELVFGLVAPLGANLEGAQKALQGVLESFGYKLKLISLSDFLHSRSSLWNGIVPSRRDEYIEQHQKAGNEFRRNLGKCHALAAAATLVIAEVRPLDFTQGPTRHAYLIRQLKLPEEVSFLRSIYGERFMALGLYTPLKARIKTLAGEIAASYGQGAIWTLYEQRAKDLITIDQTESDEFGQNVQETFPLCDVFLEISAEAGQTSSGDAKFEKALHRFVSLLFGKPDETPTTEEFLMFQARSVALRSGDLSRQVGAVIATRSGSTIAVGDNDDPLVGGGIAPVSVRHKKDRSEERKRQLVGEALDRLADWLQLSYQQMDKGQRIGDALKQLAGTRLLGLSDFGRMVHAEMAALLDAAMRGVAVRDQVMFCTTFPCQNCAKHILASGIRAVIHLEPYPKSLVEEMFEGEIEIGPMPVLDTLASFQASAAPGSNQSLEKLLVCTYLGVAPRRYAQLFTMPVRRGPDGNLASWESRIAALRAEVATTTLDYIQREKEAPAFLSTVLRI
jgi:deoxycytidylate deaminase